MYGAKIESGGDEVVCKCKYCSDKTDHYHMYISIPKSENELSQFNCFLCHTGGVVTYKRLIEWGIYDDYWNREITNHNRVAGARNPLTTLSSENAIFNTVPFNRDTESNRKKLDYFNNRLGLNFSIEDASANGIVLNLKDTLSYNRVQNITRDIRVVESLSEYFIGFLSYDGNFVNLRRIIDSGFLYKGIDKKYINYNIYGKIDNTLKFIPIPSSIDLMQPVQVHIAEGAFDIFSARFNLRGLISNSAYFAVSGNAYKGLIRYLICGIGIINMEIHLYLDNDDAGRYTLKDLLDELRPYPFPVYTHINTIGKDMGVTISEIKEYVQRVK
jgi:hypothetical protein